MRRREFLTLAGAAAAYPRLAFGQQPAKVPLVAVLSYSGLQPLIVQTFQEGLADFGLVDGKNIVVDFFIAPTNADLPAFAEKVIAAKPDVIWAYSAQAAQALKDATQTVPVVFYTSTDPVQIGLIPSLAHPGGNLTGNIGLGAVAGKLVEFLGSIIPGLARIAVFEMTVSPVNGPYLADISAVADALKIELTLIDVKEGEDFRSYFARAIEARAQAVYAFGTTYTTGPSDGKLFGELEAQTKIPRVLDPAYLAAQNNTITNGMLLSYLAVINGLPLVSGQTTWADSGALLGYGADNTILYRRAGYYIDAILKGAKPGDLAVELPTMFDLAINLKTAKALGLTIPPSVIGVATQVIA